MAFEVDGVYCKHCASPHNTPENSDNETENAMAELTTKTQQQPVEGELVEAEAVEEVIQEEKPYFKIN